MLGFLGFLAVLSSGITDVSTRGIIRQNSLPPPFGGTHSGDGGSEMFFGAQALRMLY